MPNRKDGKPKAPKGTIYECAECHRRFGNRHMDALRHLREVHNISNPEPLVWIDEKGKQHRLI